MSMHTTTGRPAAPRPGARGTWKLAFGLLLLGAIPLTAGTLRLIQLAGGPDLVLADPRFDAFPVALVLHIVGSATFALLGVLQLLPRFRRTHRGWHRRSGRMLIVAGLVVTGSALWLTVVYQPQPGTGQLLYVFRLAFAAAMAYGIVRGFIAIRCRDVAGHRAWMIRAYAIGLGAGTQVFTEGIGAVIVGTGVVAGDLAKGAGWLINLLVAEWIIRREHHGRAR